MIPVFYVINPAISFYHGVGGAGLCACDSFGLNTISILAAVNAAYFPAFFSASFRVIFSTFGVFLVCFLILLISIIFISSTSIYLSAFSL